MRSDTGISHGQVDIHIRYDGIIEIKSFSNLRQIKKAKKQSADYAADLGLNAVTVAVFISDANENVLEKISSKEINEVKCIRKIIQADEQNKTSEVLETSEV